MQAFNDLRKKARERRETAIQAAHDEYADTLASIAALEQRLRDRERPKRRTVAAAIDSVIPTDRPFTLTDLMGSLEALDSSKNFRRRTVDAHVCRLRNRGIIRRITRSRMHQPAVYVRVGVPVEPLPFEGMTLPEVVAAVLEPRQPMRHLDLVVAMMEAGYSTTMSPKRFKDAVRAVLKRDDRFVEKDGEWITL